MTAGSANELEILCPGLFARVPESWLPRGRKLAPLETLLSRADCRAEGTGGLERNLCRRLGVAVENDEEVPAGALRLLGEGATAGADFWLRADPVYLHTDRDRLVLFTMDAAALPETAAREYVEAFNSHFSCEGWRLIAPRATSWYLRAPRPLALRTRPLRDVHGKGIEHFLPWGADAGLLRRLVAEAEMLMHEVLAGGVGVTAQSALPNSLWVSGGGRLPSAADCRFDAVVSDDPLVCGLALNAGLPLGSPDRPVAATGRVLVVLDTVAEAAGSDSGNTYLFVLEQVAEQVAAALPRARRGEVDSVSVSDGISRRCRASARQLRRWWRRRRDYRSFIG